MKFTCDREELAGALGLAGRVAPSHNAAPILSNVLLSAEGKRLKITASDLDTSVQMGLNAEVGEEGSVALPAQLLSNIVGKLPAPSVTVEYAGSGTTSVRCGRSDYTVMSLLGEDYPDITVDEYGVEIELTQGLLKSLLHKTTFAAASDISRSALVGVLFEAKDGVLTLVATDTHRLVRNDARINFDGDPVSALVPSEPLKDLQRLLKDNDTPVTIRIAGSQVQFETGSVLLVSRLIDAQFPNYQKVIPDKADRVFTVRREEFVSALGRVNIVAQKAAEKVVFNVEYGTMELTAESSDVGKAFEELEASVDGEGLQFAINGRYLAEALGVISGRDVTLSMTGALNPGILRSSDDDGFLYIVMPMQVD